MPKSKRNRVGEYAMPFCSAAMPPRDTSHARVPMCAVHLTKAKKKGKDWKEGIVQHVRDAVEK